MDYKIGDLFKVNNDLEIGKDYSNDPEIYRLRVWPDEIWLRGLMGKITEVHDRIPSVFKLDTSEGYWICGAMGENYGSKLREFLRSQYGK